MKIIVDAHGGDHAPLAVIQGCIEAVKEYGVEILLCGRQKEIIDSAAANGLSLNGIVIHHCEDIITMQDDPTTIAREHKDCSMAVGQKLLAEGKGDAFLSAGNTGALLVGSRYFVKCIKGIKRPALAPILPSDKGCYMLIDAGANVECRPDVLLKFGIMGSIYMKKVIGLSSPRVGLANIGEEDTKGTDTLIETYKLMKNAPFNFVGNVEGRDIPAGACDVLVTDGFTGNMILKLTEGLGLTIFDNIKEIFTENIFSKIAALMLMKGLKKFKKKFDYTEYGGAPLMGISRPVIKAHGSSNANAIKNAIRQAKLFVSSGVNEEIFKTIEKFKDNEEE